MRQKFVMTALAVSLFCSAGALAQPAETPIDVQRIDIAAEYLSLRTLPSAEVREAYHSMPSTMRRELWTEHLVTFLREHPELDTDQRSVILEGIGLLATGILDIDPSDLRRRELAGVEIERVVAKAKQVLPQELAWAAFYRLNHASKQRSNTPPERFRVRTNTVECECSHYLGGCEEPYPICVPRNGVGFCVPVPSYNCGPYYYYACDGLCQSP